MGSGARLGDLTFRASHRYELVLHDRLRPEERWRFEELAADPDHWGVLRPIGAGTYRAVDRQTALLLFSLREFGPLPRYLLDGVDERLADQLRAMVLDGILEARTAAGEEYDPMSGSEAEGDLGIDARSLAALRYGVALGLDDVRQLTLRLYLYGGEPLSRELCDRFGSLRKILEFLRFGPGGCLRRGLPTGWTLDARPKTDWIYLVRAEPKSETRGHGGYKLYVASAVESLPDVLVAVVHALGRSKALKMKMGANPVDLARADKVVVYFADLEALQDYAALLEEPLEALAVGDRAECRSVPFTAATGRVGRLSWGVDPPDGALPIRGVFTSSWRSWLTSRLAGALVASRAASEGRLRDDELLRAVIERVRLDGVDVDRWTPTPSLWNHPP